MSTITAQTLTVNSSYALQINASAAQPVTLYVKAGGTIYYSSERIVSSASNEGSVAEAAKHTITQQTWVISASNSTVELQETLPENFEEVATNPPGFYAGNWAPIAATSGTDATPAEKKLYLTSLFLPVNKKITGIGYVAGSVGGTNKVIAALLDASGNVVAHSSETTEGTTVGTTAEVQALAFTAPYVASGPANYFIGITMNGGTARYRAIPANTAGANILAGEVAITTKNVLPASVTPPTTFTGDKGPVAFVY
jgi:hypothetical protein